MPLKAPTLRQLLALLLVRANHSVTTDELVDLLWRDAPQAGARKTVQVYMHRLRQALGDDVRIEHGANGYSLVTANDELDSIQFFELAAQARVLRREGTRDKAADLLREALDLWRGPALGGIADHPLILDEARRLDEQRLAVATEHIEIELELGRHVEMIPQIIQIVENNPYHEDLQGQLMLALYRAGRQAEALETFHRTRKLLGEELGLEPGPALNRLNSSILRSDPALMLDYGSRQTITTPKELPPAVTGFSGRASHLATLDGLFAESNGSKSTPIALITGSGGVGKTATAVQWAHQTAGSFPDGQLFVDLRGFATDSQMHAIDALTAFLRTLGVPAQQIPIEAAEAAALYRSHLSGRRMLVVLDNARSADDVRSLLPGTPSCMVIVTSRERLTGLVARNGAVRIPLEVLPSDEAHQLIVELLGAARRAATTHEVVDNLAAACAYLPLALRIAVAHILDRPYETVADQVSKLKEGSRLEKLAVEGDDAAAVRSTLTLSYQAVSLEAQLLFRRLGLVDCPDFTADSSSALADLPLEHTVRLLDRLTDAHLISPRTAGRFVIHDLLRAYAYETCITVDSLVERNRAVHRLCRLYLARTVAAGQALYPGRVYIPTPPEDEIATEPFDVQSALPWLDSEYANVVAAIRHAAAFGPRRMAWLLADRLRGYFDFRRHARLWFVSARAALAAARFAENKQAQAAMFQMLGHAYGVTGKSDLSAKNFGRAISSSESCDWREGLSVALSNLGVVRGLQGRADAEIPLLRALSMCRELGITRAEVTVLNNLANLHRQLGDLHRARRFSEEVIVIGLERREPYYSTVCGLAASRYLLGEFDLALDGYRTALAGFRSLGNRPFEAYSLAGMSSVLLDVGALGEARESAAGAVHIARSIGYSPTLVVSLAELGRYLHRVGDLSGALDVLSEAAEIAVARKAEFDLVAVLLRLSDVQLAIGETAIAADLARRARDVSVRGQFRLCHGRALVALARAHLAQGDRSAALALAAEALDLQIMTGHLMGVAEANCVIAASHVDPASAVDYWQAARTTYQQIGAVPPAELPLEHQSSRQGQEQAGNPDKPTTSDVDGEQGS